MSKIEDDKYTREGDNDSQVRSIINQLNSDHPSKEKKREVVVRPDGTKVVRVTKKRKVMVTNEEKKSRARRQFLISLIAIVLLLGGVFAFMSYRMSAMASESYLAEKQQELCQAWGAKSVRLVNARMDGMTLTVDRVEAVFPEGCVVQSFELDGVSAPLSLSSFFTGCYTSDNVEISSANIRLNRAVKTLNIPRWQGEEALWSVRNVLCKQFNLSMGDADSSPVVIRNAEARMYESSASNHVVTLNRGTISFAGMGKDLAKEKSYKFNLLDAKAFITTVCVEDIRVNCQEITKSQYPGSSAYGDDANFADKRELAVADFTLVGRIGGGESLYGPFKVEASSLPFSLFTQGLFDRVFDAELLANAVDGEPQVEMRLSENGAPVQFRGNMLLGNVIFKDTDLKARLVYSKHIADEIQNRKYSSLTFTQAVVKLSNDSSAMTLDIAPGSMEEKGTTDIAVYGQISIAKADAAAGAEDYPISGQLVYSLPKKVLSYEYEEGIIDPIFAEDATNKHRCTFTTKLSGSALLPQDNSEAQELAADNGKRSHLVRKKNINVEEILSQHEKSKKEAEKRAQEEASSSPASKPAGKKPEDDIFATPGESDDDIFGREDPNDIFKSPSGSGSVPTAPSTVPVDPSVKF